MRRCFGLIALVILLNSAIFCCGQHDDIIYNSKQMVLRTDISSSLSLIYQDPNSEVEYATADLYFYPKDYLGMDILELSTSPNAQALDDMLHYRWDHPTDRYLPFSMTAKTRTYHFVGLVGNEVGFPMQVIPAEAQAYLSAADHIDSDNAAVIRQASLLAAGEDDLYQVVFNFARWINEEIDYNISSATIDVSQKASWVLEQRNGVCDELTSLFIAMCRSVGIPGKYISGVAYTNLDEADLWGPHAWAEVYFPGYGWIPFDVTYGEFGYIDASHVKLKESLDANEPSTRYESFGRNVKVTAQRLNISTVIVEIGERTEPDVDIGLVVPKQKVGFGSHGMIEIHLRNPNPFYVAPLLFLDVPAELHLHEPRIRHILLLPKSEARSFWTFDVAEDLRPEYVYTMPVEVTTLRNASSKGYVNASVSYPTFTADDVLDMQGLFMEEDRKTYSVSVDFSCTPLDDAVYDGEAFIMSCAAHNKGNKMLSGLIMCLHTFCKRLDLGIAQRQVVNFDIPGSAAGVLELTSTLTNEDVSKQTSSYVTVLDQPLIEIRDLVYPAAVKYGEEYTITFSLLQMSRSGIRNVTIQVLSNGEANEWHFDEIDERQGIILRLFSEDLSVGLNNLGINVIYHGLEPEYSKTISHTVGISLEDIPLKQRVVIFFEILLDKIKEIF